MTQLATDSAAMVKDFERLLLELPILRRRTSGEVLASNIRGKLPLGQSTALLSKNHPLSVEEQTRISCQIQRKRRLAISKSSRSKTRSCCGTTLEIGQISVRATTVTQRALQMPSPVVATVEFRQHVLPLEY